MSCPVSVAELRTLWARTDFLASNRDFTANGIPGHPGAGAPNFNNGNPIFEVNINQIVIVMSNNASATLYPLHELSHITQWGRTLGNTSVPQGQDYQPYFYRSEGFADQLAFAIISASGTPVSDQWRYLYHENTDHYLPPTLVVPGAGGGGGDDDGGGIGGSGHIGG